MATKILGKEIGKFLDNALAGVSEARRLVDETELAYRLERNGYCEDPFKDFEYALCCPINKRKEAYCYSTHCKCHKFCIMLRKEGYLN